MNNPFEVIDARLSNIESLLLDIKHGQPSGGNAPTIAPDELLTIQQAADFLKLSVATIYGHVHRATLPVCKRDKRLYFSRQELTEWVKSGRKKTYAEIAKEANQYLDKKKKG